MKNGFQVQKLQAVSTAILRFKTVISNPKFPDPWSLDLWFETGNTGPDKDTSGTLLYSLIQIFILDV